jgi:aminoglycoside 3-N-acetyltransferase
VVPTHSGSLSDPANWANPPVPEAWWDTIRQTMPAYQAATTPSGGMGVIPEVVRSWPGARRSDHPQVSFTAVGPAAAQITADHGLTYGLGETSPLAQLYQLGARVLLLGVGHERNTSLHLAEYRSDVRPLITESGPVLVDGRRQWASWDDIDVDSTDFAAIGADFEGTGAVRLGPVGHGTARLMSQREVVDFATAWLARVDQPETA